MTSLSKLLLLMTTLIFVSCAPRQVVKSDTTPVDSTPVTTVEPTATIAPAPSTSTHDITLAFVGDIMMGGRASYKLKTDGPDSFFVHTAPLLKRADIVTGNLEGPLGLQGQAREGKKYTFLVDPSAALGLARANFKLLTLANNHIMDFGVEALRSTIEILENNGLKHAGAGFNENEAHAPAWFDINGHKVAILAYSLTIPTDYWANEAKAGCAHASAKEMREDIQNCRAAGAQLVIVCCHWGQEKSTKLRSYQPYLAHEAIDAGADAVIGHHPHIWQSLEVYHGKPIAYSIGNFAFGSITPISSSGILYLSFDEKNQWSGGKIVPLDVNNYRVNFAGKVMTPKNSKKFFDYLTGASTKTNLSYGDAEFIWETSVTK